MQRNDGLFLDKTMNRVMRRIARFKNPEPMLIMHAFAAARARGWAGPDTKKAQQHHAIHVGHLALQSRFDERSPFKVRFNRRHEEIPLNRTKRRELAFGAEGGPR